MRRYSLVLAALAVAGAFSPMASKAAFIDFVALPAGHTNQVTVGATTVAGADLGVASAIGQGTPNSNGSGPALSGAHLDFTTGAFTGTDASGTLSYGPGGTVTISDASGVLFAGKFAGTTELVPETGGLFKILAAGIAGQVATGLDTFFGLSTGQDSAGILSLNFSVTGSTISFQSGDITVDPNPQGPPIGAPEPASVALVALGLPLAALLGRRAPGRSPADRTAESHPTPIRGPGHRPGPSLYFPPPPRNRLNSPRAAIRLVGRSHAIEPDPMRPESSQPIPGSNA